MVDGEDSCQIEAGAPVTDGCSAQVIDPVLLSERCGKPRARVAGIERFGEFDHCLECLLDSIVVCKQEPEVKERTVIKPRRGEPEAFGCLIDPAVRGEHPCPLAVCRRGFVGHLLKFVVPAVLGKQSSQQCIYLFGTEWPRVPGEPNLHLA